MRRKYAWEEWFARKRTVLLRGVHYKCSQSTMTQMVRNRASLHGVRISLKDTGTEVIIDVIGREGQSNDVPCADQTPVAG